MADNTPAGSNDGNGPVFATDNISDVVYPRGKLSLGSDGFATDAVGGAGAVSAAVLRTTLASDDPAVTKLASLVSPGLSARVSVTRPSNTSGYTANDVVGITGGVSATITFALGAVGGGRIIILGTYFERDAAALISGETSYILHLFNATQPAAQVDNDAFTIASGDRTAYLGSIALGVPTAPGGTLVVEQNNINKMVKLADGNLYGVLVTVGAYTPVSAAVHVIGLYAVQV